MPQSSRQSGGTHLGHEFTRARRVQVAAQQAADFGGLGVELLDQAADVVAVPGQTWLQVIDLQRQHSLDHALVDGLGANLEAGFERAHEMLTDLQGCFQPCRQPGCRSIGDDVLGCDPLLDAALEHPVDVIALAVPQSAELEYRRAVADLLHLRSAQVVLQLWVSDQHDLELTAAFDNDFGEALQGDERFGMQVVCVIDEQRDRLLGPPEQLLQVALATFALA